MIIEVKTRLPRTDMMTHRVRFVNDSRGGEELLSTDHSVFSILICKDLKEYESDKCHRVVAKMNKCIDEYSIFELFFKGCE